MSILGSWAAVSGMHMAGDVTTEQVVEIFDAFIVEKIEEMERVTPIEEVIQNLFAGSNDMARFMRNNFPEILDAMHERNRG